VQPRPSIKSLDPDKTDVTTSTAVLAAVHSHFDTELTRATPPKLPTPPWEQPDNPDQFFIEPRGDSTLALTDLIIPYTFDKMITSLDTGKAPGLGGIPNELMKSKTSYP
jgi:hypothetical protein